LSFEIERYNGVDEEEAFERYRTTSLDAGQVDSSSLTKSREEKETAEDLHLCLQLQDFHLKQADVEVVKTFSLPSEDVKEEITASASNWLRTAAASGHVEEIRETLVVSPDADSLLQTRDEEGQSLLVYAVANGHAEAVEYLLRWTAISAG